MTNLLRMSLVLISVTWLIVGPHTLSFPWKYRTVSAGVEVDGCSTKITNLDDAEDEEGEVELSLSLFLLYVMHDLI